jgi:hypothetical protein
MRTSIAVAIVACIGSLAALPARAVDATPPTIAELPARPTPMPPAEPATAAAAAPASVPAPMEVDPQRGGEPAVQRTVIDDGRARIEELRVRGQLQKITVEPKGRAPAYEILLGDGAHVVGDDPGTSRGSAGKRVWNVLRF